MSTATRTTWLTCAATALVVLSACGSDDQDTDASNDGPVSISVMGLPPQAKPELRQAFLDDVEAFEQAHPDIDVEPSDFEFDAQTFSARLAGGNVETVLRVPFTEPQGLIERGQVADITSEVESLGMGAQLEDRIVELMSDESGAIYGLPERTYAIGLVYNRELFAEAGLDPDSPPTDWEGVREAAQALKDVADTPYAELTTSNQGGWHLAMMTYAHGGSLEEEETDGSYVASFNDEPTKQALRTLHAMRWEDDTMGDEQLRAQADALRSFAAGEIGMWMAAPDVFNGYVANFDGDPEQFSIGSLPQAGGNATLTGGWVTMVSADATEAQREAAVRWIDYQYLRPQYDPEAAAEQAQVDAEGGVAVGIPNVPIFDEETTDAVQEAIREYATFPLDNATPYLEGTEELDYRAEPPVAAQEVYSALDPVIQSVLTDENADIDQLLSEAEDQANASLRRQQ